jgi:hypothetical protein
MLILHSPERIFFGRDWDAQRGYCNNGLPADKLNPPTPAQQNLSIQKTTAFGAKVSLDGQAKRNIPIQLKQAVQLPREDGGCRLAPPGTAPAVSWW